MKSTTMLPFKPDGGPQHQSVITDVRFTAASKDEAETGLLGWCSCVMNGTLRMDGIAVRRTVDGRRALSFPARRDGQGRQHAYLCPIDDATRLDIEEQIFGALGIR